MNPICFSSIIPETISIGLSIKTHVAPDIDTEFNKLFFISSLNFLKSIFLGLLNIVSFNHLQ